MGLRTLLQLSVFEPNDFDSTGQYDLSQGRPIPKLGSFLSTHLIEDASLAPLKNETFHLLGSCKVFERSDRNRDAQGRRVASFPDNASLHPITCQGRWNREPIENWPP